MHRKGLWQAAGSLLLLLFLAAAGGSASAQAPANYPTRAVDVIGGFGPGGTTDSVVRLLGQYLTEKWKVPVNMVNKPGGNTVPAQLDVYNAKPDGYTLYADNIGSSSMLQVDQPDLPFKVMDRTFIATINSNPMLLFVAPGSPINNLNDLAARVKKDPGSFTWSAVGVAVVPMRQFFTAIGVDINKTKPIVSTGSVAANVLVAGGNAEIGVASVGPSIGPIQSGLIKPIAVTSTDRWSSLKNVATSKEQGFPTVYVDSWIGITGPPNLPEPIVKKWEDAIADFVKQPEIVTKLDGLATEVYYKNSKDFRAQVGKELDDFTKVWNAK